MTTERYDFKLSVLLVREGDTWVAQCLQYDIAAQGKTIADAKAAFAHTFAGQVCVDLHHSVKPMSGFQPAPKEYWDRFLSGERLVDRQPIYIPSVPPAFMIHAMADEYRVAA